VESFGLKVDTFLAQKCPASSIFKIVTSMVRNIMVSFESKIIGFGGHRMAASFGYKTVGSGDRQMFVFPGLFSRPPDFY
jgi:hypothetical protein